MLWKVSGLTSAAKAAGRWSPICGTICLKLQEENLELNFKFFILKQNCANITSED